MFANALLLLTAVWALNHGAKRNAEFSKKCSKRKKKKSWPIVINVTPENVLSDPARSTVQLFAFYAFVKVNKIAGAEIRTIFAQCLRFVTHAVFKLYEPWSTLVDGEVDHWQSANGKNRSTPTNVTKGTLMKAADGTYASLVPMTLYSLLCLPGLAFSLRDPVGRLIRTYAPTLADGGGRLNYRLGSLRLPTNVCFFDRFRNRVQQLPPRYYRLIFRFKFNAEKTACKCLALFVVCLHLNRRHWITNNIIGVSQTVTTVEMVRLTTFGTAFTLLACYFLLDIFWVYMTDIMVTVAGGVDAPLKLVFPENAPLHSSWLRASPETFKTLGLGDIIIPGYFASLTLRYAECLEDYEYYYAVLAGYTVGMCSALIVAESYHVAQPFLLYTILGSSSFLLALAFWKNTLKPMMVYNE